MNLLSILLSVIAVLRINGVHIKLPVKRVQLSYFFRDCAMVMLFSVFN